MSINLENVSYVYMPGTPFERQALKNVSLEIPEGRITAIAGHTGSGKSTLIQQLNGLLKPSDGVVEVDGININEDTVTARMAKRLVGMVFQYAEHQLFEETVEKDIAFGPRNMGLSEEEIQARVREAMNFVNLDYDTYAKRSPFQLSGGQMRRAAIAGIIAMKPKYLVLDEPVAGLDPRGREDLLRKIKALHDKQGITIIFISHNMEDIARLADKVIIMKQVELLLEGAPEEVFEESEVILSAGLMAPKMSLIIESLKTAGMDIEGSAYTIQKGVSLIQDALRRKEKCLQK